MKNIEELDGLLKSGMEGFTPTPPDVWSNIAQQVQVSPPAADIPSQPIWQAVKQASVLVKSAVIIGASTLIGAVVIYNLPSEKPAKNPNQNLIEMAVPEPGDSQKENSNQAQEELVRPVIREVEKRAEKVVSSKDELPGVILEKKLDAPEVSMGITPALEQKVQSPSADKNLPVVDKIPLTENFDGEDSTEPSTENETYDKPHFGNVFSPDGDGKNDTWEIIMEVPKYYHLRIFDRGGKLVYETENLTQSWTGMHGKTGMLCENGAYAFQLEYQYPTQNKVQIIRGMVTLIR